MAVCAFPLSAREYAKGKGGHKGENGHVWLSMEGYEDDFALVYSVYTPISTVTRVHS